VNSAVLKAKIDALMRRTLAGGAATANPKIWTFKNFSLNGADRCVSWDGRSVRLTSKEFDLALIMFNNLDRTLTRDYLLKTVWGLREEVATRTLDTHMARLRQKLGFGSEHAFSLVTIYGLGYRLQDNFSGDHKQAAPGENSTDSLRSTLKAA
jgi:DNA-binding response OmpR family regulator